MDRDTEGSSIQRQITGGRTVITSFQGEYRFLSNFHPSPITIKGQVYPTVEHAYQAGKALYRDEREMIQQAISPGQAKRLGKIVIRKPDFEERKLKYMEKCLREKFKDPRLARLLLNTGSQNLIEGNTWGDRFWGVCHGKGENHLGRLLMKIREEL